MRGPWHERLRQTLYDAWKAKVFTQESLSDALKRDQSGLAKYLNNKGAGTLDLDEADLALRHCGSSLNVFIAGQIPMPTPRRSRPAPLLEQLMAAVSRFDDDQLTIVLGVARSVKRAGRRTTPKSTRPLAAAPAQATRKTGGKR